MSEVGIAGGQLLHDQLQVLDGGAVAPALELALRQHDLEGRAEAFLLSFRQRRFLVRLGDRGALVLLVRLHLLKLVLIFIIISAVLVHLNAI